MKPSQSGNIVMLVLVAIVLIGLVTVALRSGGMEGSNVDKEKMAVAASQVKQFAAELERGTSMILSNGISELDIRFAHPDLPAQYGNDFSVNAPAQLFSPDGGAAELRPAPSGVNDGSLWEFYGNTALPGVGSDANPDLIAVLPHVVPEFCRKINEMDGYAPDTQPADPAVCLNSGAANRFSNADGNPQTPDDYQAVPNTADPATFSLQPAMEGCVSCPGDGTLNFFHVLHAR